MNATIIAAALATVTFAAVPDYLRDLDKLVTLADDCKYITKAMKNDDEQMVKAGAYCRKKCYGITEEQIKAN